jgi:phosphoribosylanthranilate isomerase
MRMSDIETFVIKVCGITTVDDARAAVEAGASALGFNFYSKSPRYVTPQQVCSITDAVPGSYLRVGVFVNASEKELLSIAERAGLDVLQLHGDSCDLPRSGGYRIWRGIAGEAAFVQPDDRIEAYLLDSVGPEYGGSGKPFRWEMAAGFAHRIVVAGGLDALNVAAAIEVLHPWGVDACSRIESHPGKKDHQRMRAFIQAARFIQTAQEDRMVKL